MKFVLILGIVQHKKPGILAINCMPFVIKVDRVMNVKNVGVEYHLEVEQ